MSATRMTCSLSKRVLIVAIYVIVLIVQLYLWPVCEDDSSYSLAEEMEDIELDLPHMPKNTLDPPIWNPKHYSGHCGTWQKQYTTLHRAIVSGKTPPSYLVYTTGRGFPPVIESIPHAMRGIATVFILALLTERAFILDWKAPAGFENVFSPRYIDWRADELFENSHGPHHIHDIGSPQWFRRQNGSVDWYSTTDNFNEYFINEVEVIQGHSYDFTYALLRNPHYKFKIKHYDLHNMRCVLCCVWHYLFKFSPVFLRNMNTLTRTKLGLSKAKDLIFINIPIQSDNLPRNVVLKHANNTIKCAHKVSALLKNPAWALASNNLAVLEEMPKMYTQFKPQGVFYSQERYLVDLERQNASRNLQVKIPRTEQNALMFYFLGLFVQLNSTVLFSYHNSPYSETMAAFRYFYYPSGRYLIYPHQGCQLQRYRL